MVFFHVLEKSLDYESGERVLPHDPNRYEFERIYRWSVNHYSGNHLKALDFGCGSGFGTHILSQHFFETVGVDVSSRSIDFNRRMYSSSGLTFEAIDETIDVNWNAEFDRIFSFQVIEHIPLELVAHYLQVIYRALSPGGVALITTPNAFNYWGGHSGFIYHVKEYTSAELYSLVSESLPGVDFSIKGVKDVLSTSLRLRILKFGRNHFLARFISLLVYLPLSRIERSFQKYFINDSNYILESGVSSVWGSLLITLYKPS